MTDTLGYRCVMGVITPSVNTCVQPEFEAMRPPGVTNHVARMFMQNATVRDDKDFLGVVDAIDRAVEPAVERVMTARPDHLIVGVSIEAIWGGRAGGEALRRRIEDRSTCPVTLASDALLAALAVLKVDGPIAVISPYRPPGLEQVKRYFAECGIEVRRAVGITGEARRSPGVAHETPIALAHLSKAKLCAELRRLDGDDIAAIVQFGANIAMAEVAAEGCRWLGKPVIAVNAATYWHGLRQAGIPDRIQGFGPLLELH